MLKPSKFVFVLSDDCNLFENAFGMEFNLGSVPLIHGRFSFMAIKSRPSKLKLSIVMTMSSHNELFAMHPFHMIAQKSNNPKPIQSDRIGFRGIRSAMRESANNVSDNRTQNNREK
jgi:hypothetical protein